jgi:DNA-binding NtrC family response regulator
MVPARIVIVHDDSRILVPVVTALRAAGHDVRDFADPMVALDALKPDGRAELLITRMRFPPGKPNGVALARMAMNRRPGLKVLLTAHPSFAEHADGVGEFLPAPLDPAETIAVVERMLASGS